MHVIFGIKPHSTFLVTFPLYLQACLAKSKLIAFLVVGS